MECDEFIQSVWFVMVFFLLLVDCFSLLFKRIHQTALTYLLTVQVSITS